VTAGVYLIVRSNFVFDHAEAARTAVVVVALLSLFWGAIIGCAKDDIKKVLAGSTMSQIGYMMLAAGLGVVGYPLAIFHLLNHGFFKADMFLGAGSVMHGMDDDVDMRHYGMLRKLMPVTFLTFTMGYLAIIGIPPFSGFWSKDAIIEAALTQNWFVGTLAIVGAGVTGFYMTRLMLMTFFTNKRWADEVHPHESPKVMTFPLIVLAALSALGGLMILNNWIVDYLQPVTGTAPEESPPIPAWSISVIALCVVAVGVAVAWRYVGQHDVPREAPVDVSFATRAARNELYGNEINDTLVVKPGGALVRTLTVIDERGIDGAVEGGALGVAGSGLVLRRLQTGFVRSYALSLLAGALIVVVALLAVNAA
jgi:NADH-quinone oxidoreductase subunit L